jgi:two-component system NtrC family sensor kinase
VRFLVSVAPLDVVGGETGSVVTWNDVSEVSRMQEQLSRSKRLAMVGQLAAGVAHEINNPVASIAACAEAALRDMRQSSDTAALAAEHQWTFHLEQIVEQALRCKSITRGLLDMARQRRPSLAARNLNELVTASVRLAEQRADPAKVSYALELDADLGEIAIDAGMVQQVLDNLLINARDALGRDGGKIKITTCFDAERVAIDVSDTGQGIAPDQLARIFDPFYTTKETGKGSGLGLAISCTLAEGMGGSLTVKSKPGAGSTFRLWLPQRMPEKDPT